MTNSLTLSAPDGHPFIDSTREFDAGHAVYPTGEASDGMAQSGMEAGMSQGYELLDALLAGN